MSTQNNIEHHDAADTAALQSALQRRTSVWKPLVATVAFMSVMGGLVAFGALPRLERKRDVLATNEKMRSLSHRVTVVPAAQSPPTRSLTLPSSLKPNATTELFAQATGYVKERRVDIGDQVKTGDLLAVLDVPLLNEELNRARAALKEAEAACAVLARNHELAKSTLERWKSVEPPGAVSKQELDERQSAVESANAAFAAGEATIVSRRADVQRLEQSQAFSRIVAPFNGTITNRDTEIGDYVASGSAGKPLFRLADTQTLRAFVDVPQTFAPGIVVGGTANIRVREQQGKVYTGTISRTSGALDERTRTLRVEVRIPNESGALMSGSYAQIELVLPRDVRAVVVPGSAVLIRAEGVRVPTVTSSGQLQYNTVRIGRDLGSEVEILEGLKGDEQIVVNMADEIPEGTVVDVVPLNKPAPAAR